MHCIQGYIRICKYDHNHTQTSSHASLAAAQASLLDLLFKVPAEGLQNDSYLDHVLHGPKTTGVDIQDSLGCWDPEFEFFRHTSLIFFSKRSFNHRKARNNWIQMRGPCHFSADSTLPLRCQRFTAACSGTFTQKRRSPTFSVAWILGDKVLPTSITT